MTTSHQKDIVHIKDQETDLFIDFIDCITYHGRDSIGGLALGFRLMQWAISELCPHTPPQRNDIQFRTAFPGPGLRDAVELISRAYTQGRYQVIKVAPDLAPEGVYGNLYFEIQIKQRCLKVSIKPGVISDDFIQTGRASKKENVSESTLKHWRKLKDQLAQTVLNSNIRDILNIHY